MTHFRYKALDYKGQNCTGLIEAINIEEASSRLSEKNLFVSTINSTKDKSESGNFLMRLKEGRNKENVTILTRQLCTLLRTGVPISEAIDALALEMEDKSVREVLVQIRDAVLEGRSLSDAMSDHPHLFGKIYLGLVKVGQASGQMDLVLEELAKYLVKQDKLKKKLTGSLIYPVLLMLLGSVVVSILVTFVIPSIAEVLQEGGQKLPPSTEILMILSSIFRAVLPWALILAPIIITVGIIMLKNPHYKIKWDAFILKIPLVGKLLCKGLMARFSMTFAILLKSGIPALESLEVLEDTTDNLALKKAIRYIREDLIAGSDISSRVHEHSIFPHLMGFMISVGEKSGKLDEVLHYISSHYEEDLEHEIEKFTRAFEPVMIVVMATVIGLIVFSVVSAILEMSNIS
jgi:general secretion pathway protein F